jgi:hypothetical protein
MLRTRPNEEGYWWFIPYSDSDAVVVHARRHGDDWFVKFSGGGEYMPHELDGRFERVEPPSCNNMNDALYAYDNFMPVRLVVVTREVGGGYWSYTDPMTMNYFSEARIDFRHGVVEMPSSITFGSLQRVCRTVKRFIEFSRHDWSV